MPPEGEVPLADASRTAAVSGLKTLLRQASETIAPPPPQPPSRLNRFHYNNTVRDLFLLNRDVFELPEKLMTRYDDYLRPSSEQVPAARLPDTVHVASHALRPWPGLAFVKPFPNDLRAEHEFDNQADRLTLSPLLLDAFLRLSVSIVESPDFNADTVGCCQSVIGATTPTCRTLLSTKSKSLHTPTLVWPMIWATSAVPMSSLLPIIATLSPQNPVKADGLKNGA